MPVPILRIRAVRPVIVLAIVVTAGVTAATATAGAAVLLAGFVCSKRK